MSTINIVIVIVAVIAVVTIIGVRSGPRVTHITREVVRRDENDDA